jgi:hypothetical protein
LKNIQKIADDIFKAPSSDELLQRWLEDNATKNEDGTYSSFNQTVDITEIVKHIIKDGKLMIKFKRVAGNFDCVDTGLTTLEGCPEYIGGWFDCSKNKLTSLKGFPKYIAGDVWTWPNKRYFKEEEIRSICKVIGNVHAHPRLEFYDSICKQLGT